MGGALDRAVGDLLVEAMSPLALEVALSVQEELQARADEADRLRHQQVERARYEAELAQRRYLRVDPDNRLVASSLEAEWDAKLRALAAAQDDYERQRAEQTVLDDAQRQKVLALATDFPRMWADPATPARERKAMARLHRGRDPAEGRRGGRPCPLPGRRGPHHNAAPPEAAFSYTQSGVFPTPPRRPCGGGKAGSK